jgi:hypothetical protein
MTSVSFVPNLAAVEADDLSEWVDGLMLDDDEIRRRWEQFESLTGTGTRMTNPPWDDHDDGLVGLYERALWMFGPELTEQTLRTVRPVLHQERRAGEAIAFARLLLWMLSHPALVTRRAQIMLRAFGHSLHRLARRIGVLLTVVARINELADQPWRELSSGDPPPLVALESFATAERCNAPPRRASVNPIGAVAA